MGVKKEKDVERGTIGNKQKTFHLRINENEQILLKSKRGHKDNKIYQDQRNVGQE